MRPGGEQINDGVLNSGTAVCVLDGDRAPGRCDILTPTLVFEWAGSGLC